MKRPRFLLTALLLTLAATGLSGCKEKNKGPNVDAGPDLNLKENRSSTVAGTVTGGKSPIQFQWRQKSGPGVLIANPNALSTAVTAPSVVADATAVLELTATDRKGESDRSELTIYLKNNRAPNLADWTLNASEKAVVNLHSPASDSDGHLTGYQWHQVGGPSVSLTGADSANASFTAPSVSSTTELRFALTATDDDNESTQAEVSVTVQSLQIGFTFSGKVIGDDFAGAALTADIAGQSFSGTADSSGNYNLVVQLDDDALNRVGQIRAQSLAHPDRQLMALMTGFAERTPTPSKRTFWQTVNQLWSTQSAVADAGNQLDISSVSTALYALIIEQNGGAVPDNIVSLQYAERSLDPDLLIEAAAVVQILIDNPGLQLPVGVDSVLALLADAAAYNALISTIEADSPGLIDSTVLAIAADPELTPPLQVDDIPASYVRTYPAAPTLFSRGGELYTFAENGSGELLSRTGRAPLSWSLNDGDITLQFTPAMQFVQVYNVAIGTLGLSQADVDLLQANGIFQVQGTTTIGQQVLQRVTDGISIDTFRIRHEGSEQMSPVTVNDTTVNPGPRALQVTDDALMKDGARLNTIAFTAEALNNQYWSLNNYRSYGFFDGSTRTDFYADVLQFLPDGTGTAHLSERSFNWSLNNGELTVNYSDGSSSNHLTVDQDGADHSVLTLAYDSNHTLIGAQVDYGMPWDQNLNGNFDNVDFINGTGDYWQTTINSWRLASWHNGRMYFWLDNDPSNGTNYFGWQFNGDGSGYRVGSFNGLPPNFSPINNGNNSIGTAHPDGTLNIYQYGNVSCLNDGSACRNRKWDPIRLRSGALGTRLYVLEEEFAKAGRQSGNPWGYRIGPRLNMYERIPYNYWNTDVADLHLTGNHDNVKRSSEMAIKRVLQPTAAPNTQP